MPDAVLTGEAVQKAYPTPTTAAHMTGYCVGGALCRATGYTNATFPAQGSLARWLKRANPALPSIQAWGAARAIITVNDVGRFEDAWFGLGCALAYADDCGGSGEVDA